MKQLQEQGLKLIQKCMIRNESSVEKRMRKMYLSANSFVWYFNVDLKI